MSLLDFAQVLSTHNPNSTYLVACFNAPAFAIVYWNIVSRLVI